MNWALFWFVAFCFVSTLVVLDNWESIQVWLRKRFWTPVSDFGRQQTRVTNSGTRANDIGAPRAKVTASAQTKVAPPLMPHRTARTLYKARIMGRYLGGIASFLLRRPLTILFLAGFVVIAVTISGCVPDWGKSKDELRFERELAQAEAETQAAINARDAVIARAAQDAALSRERIRQASQRGRDAIAAAAPDNEAPVDPDTVAALRAALDELCYPRADGSRADSCGPSSAPAV